MDRMMVTPLRPSPLGVPILEVCITPRDQRMVSWRSSVVSRFGDGESQLRDIQYVQRGGIVLRRGWIDTGNTKIIQIFTKECSVLRWQ
jgi:hypothetical protein